MNKHKYPKEITDKIKETYRMANNGELKGHWLSDLADEINVHKTNISRWARRHDLTHNNRNNITYSGEAIRKEYKCCICGDTFIQLETEKRKTCGKKECIHKANSIQSKKSLDNRGGTVWTNKHPRGMLGKHHSENMRNNQSKRMVDRWKNMTKEDIKKQSKKTYKTAIKNGAYSKRGGYSRSNGGKRKDLNNVYFRSSWESNYARYLNLFKIEWEYEPKRFLFESIKRGIRSYAPDFRLPKENKWIEVKGWLDKQSKTKLKRFKKYYPDEFEKTIMVIEKNFSKTKDDLMKIGFKENQFEYYSEIKNKASGFIKEWE